MDSILNKLKERRAQSGNEQVVALAFRSQYAVEGMHTRLPLYQLHLAAVLLPHSEKFDGGSASGPRMRNALMELGAREARGIPGGPPLQELEQRGEPLTGALLISVDLPLSAPAGGFADKAQAQRAAMDAASACSEGFAKRFGGLSTSPAPYSASSDPSSSLQLGIPRDVMNSMLADLSQKDLAKSLPAAPAGPRQTL